MAEWTLKYADARGEIHQQVAEAATEREVRDRYTQQGFLIYSIRPRSDGSVGLRSSGHIVSDSMTRASRYGFQGCSFSLAIGPRVFRIPFVFFFFFRF